jgi:hypothetical protein
MQAIEVAICSIWRLWAVLYFDADSARQRRQDKTMAMSVAGASDDR